MHRNTKDHELAFFVRFMIIGVSFLTK